MAARKQKRDNAYYLKRLEKEHPAIFADLKAGRFPSIRQALNAAGLRQERRQLDVMKAAWGNASVKERADFLLWTRGSSSSSTFPTAIDADRRLLPAAAARVKHIMDRRGQTTGDVMHEMGLKRLNPALGNALSQRTRITHDLDGLLGRWLDDNRSF